MIVAISAVLEENKAVFIMGPNRIGEGRASQELTNQNSIPSKTLYDVVNTRGFSC